MFRGKKRFNGFGESKLKKRGAQVKCQRLIFHTVSGFKKQNNMKSNVDGNHGLVTVEVEPKAVHHLAISPRFHKNWAVCCRWKDPASPMQDSFSGQTRLIFAILSHSSSHRCKSSNWRWYHPSSNPTFQSFEFACIKMLGKSEPQKIFSQNLVFFSWWWIFHGTNP